LSSFNIFEKQGAKNHLATYRCPTNGETCIVLPVICSFHVVSVFKLLGSVALPYISDIHFSGSSSESAKVAIFCGFSNWLCACTGQMHENIIFES
jgi:hypothetical protein